MSAPGVFREGRGRLFLRLTLWGVGQALLAVLTVVLIRHAFDRLFAAPPTAGTVSLGVLAAGLCGIAAMALVLRVMERSDAEALGQAYAASLRLVLFDHLLHLPLPVWRRKRRGHLMLRFLGDLNAVQTWVSRGLARLLVSSVSIAGALAA
jgi:ABC-type multidrug transport system fused ATPase/permease subunit